MSDDFFALPAFKPDEALVQLKRQLRELRAFSERGALFELQGVTVLELKAGGDEVQVRIARRRTRQPEWDQWSVKSSADARRVLDDIKRRLVRWTDED